MVWGLTSIRLLALLLMLMGSIETLEAIGLPAWVIVVSWAIVVVIAAMGFETEEGVGD